MLRILLATSLSILCLGQAWAFEPSRAPLMAPNKAVATNKAVTINKVAVIHKAPVARPINDKWALLIGVSKFDDPKIPKLTYSAKDAGDFYNYLTTEANFAKDHVLLLQDDKASKENILDAVGDGWLPRRVRADDLVVIYISTHGSTADEKGENFIVASDTKLAKLYSTGIRLQDLPREITKRTGCDRLVLLLDACHSGAVEVGGKGLVRRNTNFDVNSLVGNGEIVMSSSQKNEVSWESKRKENSVFTACLIDALRSKGVNTRLSEAFDQLKEHVEQEVQFDRRASQTPEMRSLWQGEPLALGLKPAHPRSVLPELPAAAETAPKSETSTVSNRAATDRSKASLLETALTLNNSGVSLLHANDYKGAITCFRQALKVDPGYKYASDNLAIAYNNQALKLASNDPQAAKQLFEQALVCDPNNQTTKQNLQTVMAKLQLALATSNQTAPLTPGPIVPTVPTVPASQSVQNSRFKNSRLSPAKSIEQGRLLYRKGDFDDALAYFDNAIAKDPTSAEAYLRRANTYIHLERADSAVTDSTKAIQLKPDYAEAYCTRASASNDLNRYQNAIADCSSALGLKPNLKTAYVLRSTAYRAQKQSSLADLDEAKAKTLTFDEVEDDEWKGDVDFGPFMASLQRKIKSNWYPPKENLSRRVMVVFKIHHDGALSDWSISRSSGDRIVDQAGLDAVKRTGNVGPLPLGAPPNVDLQFTFDYNVKKAG